MKRALLENNKVILNPDIVDRKGFLSAIFALKVSGSVTDGTTASIMIEHCDTEDGEFEAVQDTEVYPSLRVNDKKPGMLEKIEIVAEKDINIDIDLLGCRRFLKITASFKDGDGGSAEVTYAGAIVLGDSTEVPV